MNEQVSPLSAWQSVPSFIRFTAWLVAIGTVASVVAIPAIAITVIYALASGSMS